MNVISKFHKAILCLIPIISLALHWHIFNLDLIGIHVWRQTETQTVINNFYRDSMNIFDAKVNNFVWPNRDFRLEFPILEWLYACFYKVFGAHIIVSRALTFLLGLCSVWGIYRLCQHIFNNKEIAVIGAWCFNFSPLFYYYTVNPLPDNMALCCGIWSIVFFYNYICTARIGFIILSAIFLCVSALVKLPFIVYGSFILTFFILQLRRRQISLKHAIACLAIFMLLAIPLLLWYLTVIPKYWYGTLVLKGISRNGITRADIFKWLWGNAVSVLPELLINYGSVLFFLFAFYVIVKRKAYKHKYFPLFAAWGLSVMLYFLFELNVICLVHDYYLLPFLPPIFVLVAYGAFYLLSTNNFTLRMLGIISFIILPLTAFLRIDVRWNTKDPNFNVSYYKYKAEIRALIPSDAYVIAGNDASEQISLYYIDRKGWTFANDMIDDRKIRDYMAKGAKYLFIDSHIDENPEVKAHIAEKIFEKENLRVYKLK